MITLTKFQTEFLSIVLFGLGLSLSPVTIAAGEFAQAAFMACLIAQLTGIWLIPE